MEASDYEQMHDYAVNARRSECFCGTRIPEGRRRYCSYPCLFHAMRARQYGLEPRALRRLWDAQGGRCAICEVAFDLEVRAPFIDHDHRSGRVRGLLCPPCNSTIRYFDAARRARRKRRRSGRPIGEDAGAWVTFAAT